MSDFPLPGLLGALQRAGHGGAALRLALEWGGTKRYIAARPAETGALVAIVGLAAARFLAAHFGNTHQDIPRAVGLGRVKREIHSHEGGTRATARALGCTERYVRKVREPLEADPKQPGLFDRG